MPGNTPNAPSFESNILIKRNIFSWKFETAYSVNIALKLGQLSEVIDKMASSLIPNLIGGWTQGGSLLNIKGRDREEGGNSESSSSQDELFYLAGTIATHGKEGSYTTEPCSVICATPFNSFGKGNEVKYQVALRHTGPMIDSISPSLLGRVWPLQPKIFRLGLDFFSAGLVSRMIGSLPSVSESLKIDANENMCSIRITSAALRSRDDLPLRDGEMLHTFSDLIKSVLGVSIEGDYKQQVASSN